LNCLARLDFERDEAASGRKRPREPDGAVSGKGADLEDAARANGLGEQHQDVEGLGRSDEKVRRVSIDGVPTRIGHMPHPIIR
jgi:hypothetical protein